MLKKLESYLASSNIARVSHELWIDGSFAESKENPNDIDILLIYHLANMDAAAVKEMSESNMAQYRAHLRSAYYVDLQWCSTDEEIGSGFFEGMYGQKDFGSIPKGIIRVRL